MVSIKNEEFRGIDGSVVRSDANGPPLTVAEVVKVFVMQLPRDRISMEDCALGSAVYYKATQTSGVLSLENAEHKWLLTQVRQYGPAFIGISAAKFEVALRATEEIKD